MSLGIGSIISVGGGTSSGSGGSGSGITSINGQTGPAITITGVNGIDVTTAGNVITIDGAGASGVGTNKFASSFSSITSGIFTHGLGTLDVIVQVYDDQVPRRWLLPDEIVIDNVNQVSILFNRLQSGRVVII
mgnify:CR=1 FL=1